MLVISDKKHCAPPPPHFYVLRNLCIINNHYCFPKNKFNFHCPICLTNCEIECTTLNFNATSIIC